MPAGRSNGPLVAEEHGLEKLIAGATEALAAPRADHAGT